jgi:hypothetical protein
VIPETGSLLVCALAKKHACRTYGTTWFFMVWKKKNFCLLFILSSCLLLVFSIFFLAQKINKVPNAVMILIDCQFSSFCF